METLRSKKRHLYRCAVYHALSATESQYWQDGALVVDDTGHIEACGSWPDIRHQFEAMDYELTVFPEGHLILPGLVDMHVHLPQIKVTGRQRPNLMDWLTDHIFPAEIKFEEPRHAQQVSQWFFRELLKNGTTTAVVFTTVHSQANRIAFETAETLGNRVVMGLNLMDRHAPDLLVRPADDLLHDTEILYHEWHGKDNGRLLYAWVPRFAISCSNDLLKGIGRLREKYPDAYCHTHISEQADEVEAVLVLFPQAKSYTDVYDHYGLLRERTILAHGIYLDECERQQIRNAGVGIAHCPSANFFLHSGRFRWFEMQDEGVHVGLGSDVGAGPELSLFKVMKDAQYMQATQSDGRLIDCHSLMYHATLGGAEALQLAHRIGNFKTGKEADFLVVNLYGKSNIPNDLASRDLDTILSSLVFLGDDRLIFQTYVRGRLVYQQREHLVSV